MIEALRSDELIKKIGGKFKLTALIQRRWLQLLQGERPLVRDIEGLTDMEIIIREILEGKIEMELLEEREEGESEEEG
jgi:DNA-directed RNA polymerase subunit omega